MSGYSAEYIQEKLHKELETVHCTVNDLSDGCGGKFECVIVSSKFEGKPLLQRHRLGMISHKKSLLTIFGRKLRLENFIKKFDIFFIITLQ